MKMNIFAYMQLFGKTKCMKLFVEGFFPSLYIIPIAAKTEADI